MPYSNYEKALDDLEKESLLQDIEIISRDKGIFLGELVEEHQPKNILEIGTSIGYSTLFLAADLPKNGKIYTCEKNLSYIMIAEGAFKKAEVSDRIEMITGNVYSTLPKLKVNFDMVFIDGDRDEYYEYLKLLEGKLNLDAVVIANGIGVYSNFAKQYLREVRDSGDYDSYYKDFHPDGIEVSVKK